MEVKAYVHTLYLLVGKQSFSVLKIFAVEPLVSNIQQFKKVSSFLRHGLISMKINN